ncbi:MAG: hypothetical protein J6X53_00220 [Abditibacteriota bacterium]|nr:hypothetical protein [Abditibacteriota bacterium]
MKKDASALCVLLVIALLSAAFSPSESAKAEPPPVETVVKVADMTVSDIEEAAAKKGWYKLGRNGLSFWGGDEASIDAVQKPPTEKFAAFMGGELMESVIGLVLLALPVVLAIAAKRRGTRRKSAKELKRVGGVSDAEFQTLKGQVAVIAAALQNIIPDSAENKNGRKKRWT